MSWTTCFISWCATVKHVTFFLFQFWIWCWNNTMVKGLVRFRSKKHLVRVMKRYVLASCVTTKHTEKCPDVSLKNTEFCWLKQMVVLMNLFIGNLNKVSSKKELIPWQCLEKRQCNFVQFHWIETENEKSVCKYADKSVPQQNSA